MSREDHRLHDEILALRQQLEQSKQPQSDMRFTLRDFIVVATSTLFAFGGMLSENEIVMYFCLVIPCIGYLYICLKHPGSVLGRSIAAAVVVVVFGVMIFLVHQRGLKKEQDDSYAKLSILPFMPNSHKLFKAGFTVTNGGGTDIVEYSVIYLANHITLSTVNIHGIAMETTRPEKTGLRANGDADTSYCYLGFQFSGSLECADVVVIVPYSIKTQPEIKKTKAFRFVAEGEDLVWHQHPVNYPGDYCARPHPVPSP
jgi:hypothetical protein